MVKDLFPETIERWCCPGKSCGNTELELVTYPVVDERTYYYYDYVRVTNGDSYTGGWKSEQQMSRWLEETKDHIQEEMDPVDLTNELNTRLFSEMNLPMSLKPELYDVGVPYPLSPYDPSREFEVWEIQEFPSPPLDERKITFTEGGMDITVTLAELMEPRAEENNE
jgi:hypothetical protein